MEINHEFISSQSRRQFVQFGKAAFLSLLFGKAAFGETMKLRNAKDAVDHLVLGVSDLQKGIDWFEKKTGVRPMVGGKHPNRGTQNALISFGNRQYLELLAPDPDQANHPRATDLLKLTEPRMVLWASRTTEIDSLAQQVKMTKLLMMGPMDGARARPDGKLLKWRSLNVSRDADKSVLYFNIVPFFINWDKDSPHPSLDAPAGCQLLSLEFSHPEAESLSVEMKALGIKAKINKASAPTIKATLNTPKGKIKLT